ncbi:site-specific integrase [Arthrobacter sp. A2-55]|uniref:site-specific integrase n=1 Tax=Arthrobacter sp. A2-55 TaxID=2897337 RepID=UPI0021CD599E|nr:site-specific integrase [Arthrobacter sp. A2-55]MCU6479035.1 site-specific integrase [Arthrobacter sp. A2-55]
MARIQRVTLDGQDPTWTVLGDDFLPVVPVEEFLEYLRQIGSSPNTVRSYARGMVLWCEFLGLKGTAWDGVRLEDLTGFLGWLRTGLPPEIATIGPPPPILVSDATAALRLQAVRSFYLFHQWRGLSILPMLSVASDFGPQYKSFLHHIRRPAGNRRATVKVARRRRSAPTLTPAQLTIIKDSCARRDPHTGAWEGSVRDRLFFSLLEETGLRIGEALSLQHRDWHSGGGGNPFIEVVPRPHPLGERVKGGKYRKLYIGDDLDRLYAEYVWRLCDLGMNLVVEDMDRAYVFVNLRGEGTFCPQRPETIYKLVGRISRDLGPRLPAGWSPHWFRHTHATALLLSGTPVHVVSRRLGHADVQTTLNTYAWVTEDEELRALADWKAVTSRWREGNETLG